MNKLYSTLEKLYNYKMKILDTDIVPMSESHKDYVYWRVTDHEGEVVNIAVIGNPIVIVKVMKIRNDDSYISIVYNEGTYVGNVIDTAAYISDHLEACFFGDPILEFYK